MTVSPPDWDPAQYERFKAERSQPFFDLLALVEPRPAMRVVDLGCGTGELTREMHRRLAAAETLGIDSSPAMIERTPAFAGDGLRFRRHDIADFRVRGEFDLVFANASLQWLPDHRGLFARLRDALRPGGQLAVQMPQNHDHATHTTAAEVAREEPFRTALGGYARTGWGLAFDDYAPLLHRLGFREQHVRLQVYPHLLASRDDAVEWVKGSLLTDYRARLSPQDFDRFLERYREALLARLPDERPFFYPFKRLLLRARR